MFVLRAQPGGVYVSRVAWRRFFKRLGPSVRGVALLMSRSLLAGVRARRALPTSGPCRAAHFAEGPEIASQSRWAVPVGCYTMVAGGARVGLHKM